MVLPMMEQLPDSKLNEAFVIRLNGNFMFVKKNIYITSKNLQDIATLSRISDILI